MILLNASMLSKDVNNYSTRNSKFRIVLWMSFWECFFSRIRLVSIISTSFVNGRRGFGNKITVKMCLDTKCGKLPLMDCHWMMFLVLMVFVCFFLSLFTMSLYFRNHPLTSYGYHENQCSLQHASQWCRKLTKSFLIVAECVAGAENIFLANWLGKSARVFAYIS